MNKLCGDVAVASARRRWGESSRYRVQACSNISSCETSLASQSLTLPQSGHSIESARRKEKLAQGLAGDSFVR